MTRTPSWSWPRGSTTPSTRAHGTTVDHCPSHLDEGGKILSDADLGILAAGPTRYAAYVAGVRQDFAALPESDFRVGRLAVLEDLVSRATLFHTDHANRHWDTAARANLPREIASLRQ